MKAFLFGVLIVLGMATQAQAWTFHGKVWHGAKHVGHAVWSVVRHV